MKDSIKNVEIISVRRFESAGNLLAFVDIRVGGALVITQCAVMTNKRGMFASLPRQLARDGRWRDVVVCGDASIKEHYEAEILKAYTDEYAPAE